MRINNSSNLTPPRKSNNNNNVNFSGGKGKAFKWVSDQCDIGHNSDLTRAMFLVVSSLFMVGARFFKARGEDERREVLTRDIPAIVISIYGAPVMNAGIAYGVTKHTGIPLLTFKEPEPGEKAKKNLGNAKFASQKQVKEWYTNLTKLENPLITFSETIEKNGGNLNKVMKKLGFDADIKAIVGKDGASNKEIIDSFKSAKNTKSDKFKVLEDKIKNLPSDNKLFKMAQTSQACIKLSGIMITAGLLGIFLPRLNIITTRNKYQHKNQNQQAQQNTDKTEQQPQTQVKKEQPAKAASFNKFI
jgi:hypothetical protein